MEWGFACDYAPPMVFEYSEEENSRRAGGRRSGVLTSTGRVGAVEEDDDVAFVAEGDFQDFGGVVENAEDADHRRGIEWICRGFRCRS